MSAIDDLAAASERQPPRKGSALHAAAPAAGAPLPVLLGWLEAALQLPAHVARVQRWGSSSASPLKITLVDGTSLRFEEAADLNRPSSLAEGVIAPLGSRAPQLRVFSKADAQDVFAVVIRACQVVEVEDAAALARDWMDGLRRIRRDVHHGPYDDPSARWAALTWLDSQPDYDPSAGHLAFTDDRYRIPVVIWDSGQAYLRVRDVVAYVRGNAGERLDSSRIVARLREAGLDHVRAEARRPGSGRRRGPEDRVRVSVLVEGPEESGDATQDDVSPGAL